MDVRPGLGYLEQLMYNKSKLLRFEYGEKRKISNGKIT